MAISAGIVLAGGRSSRMGTPKAALEWHGSTLLRRTASILLRATGGPVVVVRAAGQELPPLPAWAELAEDPREGLGPLQGIAAGLAAVGGRAEVAFACSTDLPFLHPAFVSAVIAAAGAGTDVALPLARGFPQPLAAAYRTALAPLAGKLVAAGRLRPAELFAECAVARLDEAALLADPALAAADPDLESLINVNDPEQYAAARARPEPEVTIQRSGTRAAGPARQGPARVRVRAATLARAAAAAGLSLNRDVAAAINGGQVTTDWALPLVAGDLVSFILRPPLARLRAR